MAAAEEDNIVEKLASLSIKKQELGQFMTTNVDYILTDIDVPKSAKIIVEPFCGNGDLLKIIPEGVQVLCYDIDPKTAKTKKLNSLETPPQYKGRFVLTNPPYLARNKSKSKTLFDKYDTNDLYKCFIVSLLLDPPDGGIIIIPLNFWSSVRKADVDLRRKFCLQFDIIRLNIFEEAVFDDTSYTVCAFLFEQKKQEVSNVSIIIFPHKKNMSFPLSEENKFTIGGEMYDLQQGEHKITRITSKNKSEANTNILLKCIDDSKDNLIGFSIVDDDKIYVDNTAKLSARSYASLIITPPIDDNTQAELVAKANEFLAANRKKYHSLFLTNYRESKGDMSRKRISFQMAYQIVGHVLSDICAKNS